MQKIVVTHTDKYDEIKLPVKTVKECCLCHNNEETRKCIKCNDWFCICCMERESKLNLIELLKTWSETSENFDCEGCE